MVDGIFTSIINIREHSAPPPPPPPPPVSPPGTNVQSFGAKGNGVADDTTALQNACNSGLVLYFPKTSSFYKTSGLITLKNSVYSNGAEVRLKQDGTTNTVIFKVIQNPAPLTIDNFILNGLYAGGTAGQYSAGVDLRSAANVTISNSTIMNTYGDSIYIGEQISTAPCRNIIIDKNSLLNPYRNNVSLILADGVTISNNTIQKIVDFVHGIDFEPNPNGTDYVRNVTISGNNFNCPGQCINCFNTNYPGSPAITGLIVKNNVATSIAFYYGDKGVSGPQFTSNTFTCKAPTAAGTAMFSIGNTPSGTLDSNVDQTVPAGSYKSLSQWNSTLTLTNNTFI